MTQTPTTLDTLEFHNELIERFLGLLDWHERKALGSRDRIRVACVEGSPESITLAKRTTLLISPASPVLHVQSESMAHECALELSVDCYIKAATAVGFKWLCFNHTSTICYAHCCDER